MIKCITSIITQNVTPLVLLKIDNLLPTAYVVRREGYVLTRVCLSVHT